MTFGTLKLVTADEQKRSAEEKDQDNLAAEGDMRADDDGNGKCDKKDISDDVTGTHGDQLGKALAALRSRIRHNLPIVIERTAFTEGSDDDGKKGDDEEDTDAMEDALVTLSPGVVKRALEKFRYGEFGHPDACVMSAEASGKRKDRTYNMA